MYSILHQYPPEYFYVQYYHKYPLKYFYVQHSSPISTKVLLCTVLHQYPLLCVFFTNIITLLQCYNFLFYVVMVSRTLVKHLTISCFAFFLYLPKNNFTLQALYTELLRLISIIILSNNVHYQYPFPHFERQFQILSSLEVDPY